MAKQKIQLSDGIHTTKGDKIFFFINYVFMILLAVITLYCAVNQWNSYFGPMIYLNTRSKFPLSMILRDILIANTIDLTSLSGMDPTEMADLQAMQNLMKYAVIIVASIPVMVLYPFVQRYFVKGVMLGAIKG